jgi:nicotinate-nucleotide pyrophosphorylase (carboxylating)
MPGSAADFGDEPTRRDAARLVELALAEDLAGREDITSAAIVPARVRGEAEFVARADGIVCGWPVVEAVCQAVSPALELLVLRGDGQRVRVGDALARLNGPARDILAAERTALNFLSRLSGVATLTQGFVQAIAGTEARIFDTRKTTPGWRRLEKCAVRCGGGHNHRIGLFDAILIKDNHLALAASLPHDPPTLPQLIREARAWIAVHALQLPAGRDTIVEVEVDSLELLAAALETSVDIILIDNFSIDDMRRAVEMRDEASARTRARRIELEASGGITLDNVRVVAETGVDRISVGALTHTARALDIALDWRHE